MIVYNLEMDTCLSLKVVVLPKQLTHTFAQFPKDTLCVITDWK